MFANYFKTALLLGSLSGLLIVISTLLGGTQGLTFALCMAFIINGIAYFFSDRIVLRMHGAQKLDADSYPHLYSMVEELCAVMQLPIPQLWIINTPVANAFATGRNPRHASIAVTEGILEILDADELRGVLAHELAHIKNRDILIGTIAAIMATAISYIGSMARHSLLWGSSSNKKQNNNIIVTLVVAIVVPLAATLMQLALSRSREYAADATGAHACHDPLALAAALEKLHNHTAHAQARPHNPVHESSAALFIVHPFSCKNMASLFATHPPMEKRIERLHQMHQKMF